MNSKLLVLCLLGTIALSACGKQAERLACENLLPKNSDLNTSFTLRAPSHMNSFRFADLIFLRADNNSESVIEVAPDEDIKIYWLKGNSWEPISNKVDYLSVIDRLGPRTSDDPGGTIFVVELDIPEHQNRFPVCVTVEGLVNQDKVAASVELVLYP